MTSVRDALRDALQMVAHDVAAEAHARAMSLSPMFWATVTPTEREELLGPDADDAPEART